MSRVLALILAAAVFAASPAGAVEEETYRKRAGQFSVYLTVMPSEVIRGRVQPDAPGASPQRPPAARDTHHVMVSIFDSASGLRLSGLKVKARVALLGFSGEKRDLEPISITGEVAYANSFPMLGRGPFRIDVEFQAHDATHAQQATFYFTHPSFAPPP